MTAGLERGFRRSGRIAQNPTLLVTTVTGVVVALAALHLGSCVVIPLRGAGISLSGNILVDRHEIWLRHAKDFEEKSVMWLCWIVSASYQVRRLVPCLDSVFNPIPQLARFIRHQQRQASECVDVYDVFYLFLDRGGRDKLLHLRC